MRAYTIVGSTVMLRDHDGDLYRFAPAEDGHLPAMRLIGRPAWRDGSVPSNAGVRIDLARGAAQSIARTNRIIA